jgi:hypothetical protein
MFTTFSNIAGPAHRQNSEVLMFLLQMLMLLFSCTLFAKTEIITRIHDVDYGKNGEEPLILLESGHVTKPGSMKVFLDLNKSKTWKFILDSEHRILEMSEIKIQEGVVTETNFDEEYTPSVVKGGTAKSYFNESRISHGETQCYNRAHVWAFELWKNHQTKSQKIFLFFSRKYIREHNFGWWFHVAPMLIVNEWLGGKSEKVVDPRYITAPRSIDWWIGKFVSGNVTCPEIKKYSEYADYPYSEDCYILKAPMYIYQPLDLEMLEVWGVQKNNFVQLDLEWAYKEAFQMDYHGEQL